MLQAGEVVGGYVVGPQHWRWMDYGAHLDVIVELGVHERLDDGGEAWVQRRRLHVPIKMRLLEPAIGFGPRYGRIMRSAIEVAAITGGPWVE